MKLRERNIEIDFTNAVEAILFDQMNPNQPNYHGISQMHRVDFVVELAEAVIFVEIKDPENPMARKKDIENFIEELNNGTLCSTFVSKFIDTFLYRWAEEKVEKPIYFLNLVTLDTELLLNLSDQIDKKIPPMGTSVLRWKRNLLQHCQVFNLRTWNENFPKWPAKRIATSVTPGVNQ